MIFISKNKPAKNARNERDFLRGREILRVTWVGFWLNLFLAFFKIGAGFFGNSRAVLADGVHSLSDLITNIAVLVGVRFWMAPPDESHPYGHKRLESLISFFIGVLLAVAGCGIATDAIWSIGERQGRVGGPLALAAALSSVVIKEGLYRWTIKKAREIKSEAVEATAWDHRSDAISSIPIVVALCAVMWFPALRVIDLLGAILVSGFILHSAWKICRNAANVLLDAGGGPDISEKIIEYVMRTPGVLDVHDLRTRYLGQGLQIDMHVCIKGSLTVRQGNEIAHKLEDSLYTSKATDYIGVEIFDALVHIDPWQPGDDEPR